MIHTAFIQKQSKTDKKSTDTSSTLTNHNQKQHTKNTKSKKQSRDPTECMCVMTAGVQAYLSFTRVDENARGHVIPELRRAAGKPIP